MASKSQRAIIVDLDGTLADNDHRRHLVEKDDPDWDEYSARILDDDLNEWCKEIIDRFKDDHKIYLVTGRMAKDQTVKDTKVWLAENNIYYDELHFRDNEDYREDSVVKEEILYDEIVSSDDHPNGVMDIVFAIDDRTQVVEMWRQRQIKVLQCAEGDF